LPAKLQLQLVVYRVHLVNVEVFYFLRLEIFGFIPIEAKRRTTRRKPFNAPADIPRERRRAPEKPRAWDGDKPRKRPNDFESLFEEAEERRVAEPTTRETRERRRPREGSPTSPCDSDIIRSESASPACSAAAVLDMAIQIAS
jgi:hypothetical protein